MRKRRVLKPVIFNRNLRAVGHCGAQGGTSVAGNIDGQVVGQHERLIASVGGDMAGRVDAKGTGILAAKPARQHNWLMACALQHVGQRANRRGFTGTAGGQIANANHRNFRFFRLG